MKLSRRDSSALLAGLLGAYSAVAAQSGEPVPDASQPLRLTAENAAIVAPPGGAGGVLRNYLVRFLAPPPDGQDMADPASCPLVPLVPAGQPAPTNRSVILAVGVAGASTAAGDAQALVGITASARKALRENLPPTYREDRVRFLEAMLEKNLVIPAAAAMPAFDGDLGDEAWKQAAELRDFTERGTYRVSRHATSGRAVRVGDSLVFGVECRQAGPIVAKTRKETLSGGRLWKESAVEFHFGAPAATNGGASTVAQYIVNANGAFQGFRASRDNREGCRVAVKRDDTNGVYTIEAAFPLKASGYDFTGSRILLLNLMRVVFTRENTQAEDAIVTWYPTPYTCYKDDALGLVFTSR